MGLFDKPLFQLAEGDLLALKADKEAEGKTLDYKRDPVRQGDADKKEFLYDASSFANTSGGDLVFGMEEKNGLPTDLVGLAGINPDKEILRLEQLLRDGIRPARFVFGHFLGRPFMFHYSAHDQILSILSFTNSIT